MDDLQPLTQMSPQSPDSSPSDSSNSDGTSVMEFKITHPNPDHPTPTNGQMTLSPEYDKSLIDPEFTESEEDEKGGEDMKTRGSKKKQSDKQEEVDLQQEVSFDNRDDPVSSDEDEQVAVEVLVQEGDVFVPTDDKDKEEENDDGLEEPVEETEMDDIYFAMVRRSNANQNLVVRREILMNFVAHPKSKLSSFFHKSMANDPQLDQCDKFLRSMKSKSTSAAKHAKDFNKYIVAKKLRMLCKFLVATDSLISIEETGNRRRRSHKDSIPIKTLREYYNAIVATVECNTARAAGRKSGAPKKIKNRGTEKLIQLEIIETVKDWNTVLPRSTLQCPECEHNVLVEYPPPDIINKYTRQARKKYHEALQEEQATNKRKSQKFGLEKEILYVCMCCVNTCWDITNGSGCVLCVDYASMHGSAPYTKSGGCSCMVCLCPCTFTVAKRKIAQVANEKQLKKLQQQAEASSSSKTKKLGNKKNNETYDLTSNRKYLKSCYYYVLISIHHSLLFYSTLIQTIFATCFRDYQGVIRLILQSMEILAVLTRLRRGNQRAKSFQ
jgi:hypothetical protein